MTINLKTIDKRVARVSVLGRELNTFIHETGMMIVYHAAPTGASPDAKDSGDCTRALSLVRAMPASMRRTMMIEWFQKFTPIRIKLSDNGDKCEFDAKYKKEAPADKLAWWKVSEAAELPFYDIAENTPEGKTYSLAELLKMVERLSKQIEKKVEEGKVPEEDRDNAMALARAVSGVKLPTRAQAANDGQELAA